jgi:hypothetical protein
VLYSFFLGATVENQTNIGRESMNQSGGTGGINWQWIINRAKLVLTEPKGCWGTIKSEPATVKSIYMGWILPMAGISALCLTLGMAMWGTSVMGITVTPGMGHSIKVGLSTFLMQCLSIFVTAQILSILAPKFGGQSSVDSALKLVAYSSTASLVAGMLNILPVPGVSLLGMVLGLYAIYAFYSGIGSMLSVPENKKLVYTVVSVLAIIVVMFVLNMVLVGVLGIDSLTGADMSKITIGDQTIDTQQLENLTKSLENFIPKQ